MSFWVFWFQNEVRVDFWRFENESKKNMKKRSCKTRERCKELGGQPLRIIQFQDPGIMKGIGTLQLLGGFRARIASNSVECRLHSVEYRLNSLE